MASINMDNILKRLDEHENRIKDLEEQIKFSENEMGLTKKPHDLEFPLNLCKHVGVDENQLGHIFYYEDDQLEFVCPIEGKSIAEKQFNGTILVLTFYHFWKNTNKIKSTELRKILEKEKKLNLNNFSTNLKKSEYMKYIRPDGVNGSHDFSYKITNPLGIEKGLEILKKFISPEESSEGS